MPSRLSYANLCAETGLLFHPTRRLFSSSGDQFALMAAERCFISSGVGSTIGLPERGGLGRCFKPLCFAILKSWLFEIFSSLQMSS
jgi:hypothetical protein